jgi:hypothetical protein
MEQYIHTLIAADSAFVPDPLQIEQFFEVLTESFHFRAVNAADSQPELRVLIYSGRRRYAANAYTGEAFTYPVPDQAKVEQIADVGRTIAGLKNYAALAAGEWVPGDRPLALLTSDRVPIEGSYFCEVGCNVRPEAVSVSCWNKFLRPNGPAVPNFGETCKSESTIGIFSHPWTGALIEVPDGGCARFWIEFEFGKFLVPKMSDSLDVLRPAMVGQIEDCFGTRFVQGWRFN